MGEVEYVRQGRPPGSRNRRTIEALALLDARGDRDPIDIASEIANNEKLSPETKAPYVRLVADIKHSKMASTPAPRYIETPIEVPEFTSVEVAEKFLEKINSLLAAGTLDLDFSKALRETTMGWIQSQYAKQGIDLKAEAQGAASADRPIHIQGMLHQLPGTQIHGMEKYPIVDNELVAHITNGHVSAHKLLDVSTLNPSSIDGGVHTPEPTPASGPLAAPIESTPEGSS